MCNEFKMLVELSDWRYIAQCEHKTVHLRWDHLTLSLPPQAFLHFARQILQISAAQSVPLSSHGDAPSATTPPESALRFRINTVLLEFAAADRLTLCSLLQQAVERLAQRLPVAESHTFNPPPALQPCPQPTQFTLVQHLN